MQTGFKTSYTTTIQAPAEKVWAAITQPELVKQYFFGTSLVTDWKPGSPIYFRGEWEGKPYEDKGVVLKFDAPHELAYSYLSNWSGLPDKEENYLYVAYTLRSVNSTTELTITQTNYDADKAAHSEENWASLIEGLKKLVE
ncbi:MAG: SRPBCC domain-containing protein [Cyclobacteriaceae bacterium]|nr:SRPBCC domain-containing protein [Cyclobacteriaceae bacterium]